MANSIILGLAILVLTCSAYPANEDFLETIKEALEEIERLEKGGAQVEPARGGAQVGPLKNGRHPLQDLVTQTARDTQAKGWLCDNGYLEYCSTSTCGTYSKCGEPYASKIVGGESSSISARPWQVFLYTGNSMCGGSILSENWVVTAAHCIHGKYASDLSIYAGHNESPTSTYISVTSQVSQIIEHEDYDSSTQDNDIALLKLKTALTFGSGIQPICMPDSSEVAAGTQCVVSGWGTTTSGGNTSPTLLELHIPILEGCGDYADYKITDNMVCAGDLAGGKDSCQGDSGGPLACKTGSVYYLQGVVSFGNECALANYPGVYARVSSYMADGWIVKNTGGGCYTR